MKTGAPAGTKERRCVEILSRALTADYYQHRVEETRAEQAKRRQPDAFQRRRMAIAADIRSGIPDAEVRKAHKASAEMLADVKADMALGTY